MSKLAPFAATLLALVLLTTPSLAQTPRDVLVVGMEAEPPGLDPGQALGLHSLRVTAEIFETLVVTAPDSTDVVPGLAESWTTSADGLAWTFKLRRGVRFHDGTPLDAAAVKFTFDRVIDPGHPHAKSGKWTFVTGYLSSVKAVEVLDPQTVQLQLKYPTASLLALLALPNCAIVSPTGLREVAGRLRHDARRQRPLQGRDLGARQPPGAAPQRRLLGLEGQAADPGLSRPRRG
jgi:peptide/nickel transport system substrate-binding protein